MVVSWVIGVLPVIHVLATGFPWHKPSSSWGTPMTQKPAMGPKKHPPCYARQNEGVHWEQPGLAREVRGRSRGRPLRQHRQTARAHGEISGHLPHLPWRRQETWHDWADSWAWHHWFFGNLGGVVDDMAYFVLVWRTISICLFLEGILGAEWQLAPLSSGKKRD